MRTRLTQGGRIAPLSRGCKAAPPEVSGEMPNLSGSRPASGVFRSGRWDGRLVPETLELLVQVALADPQVLGGADPVSPVARQHFLDVSALLLLDELAQGEGVDRFPRHDGRRLGPQLLEPDLPALAMQHEQPLHRALQLADVPGPAVS